MYNRVHEKTTTLSTGSLLPHYCTIIETQEQYHYRHMHTLSRARETKYSVSEDLKPKS
jgi:hypothetical protein